MLYPRLQKNLAWRICNCGMIPLEKLHWKHFYCETKKDMGIILVKKLVKETQILNIKQAQLVIHN